MSIKDYYTITQTTPNVLSTLTLSVVHTVELSLDGKHILAKQF